MRWQHEQCACQVTEPCRNVSSGYFLSTVLSRCLAYCGTNISFASVRNVTNEPFGSSKNNFHWNNFSTLHFYHQTGNNTLTQRRSLLENILMDTLCKVKPRTLACHIYTTSYFS